MKLLLIIDHFGSGGAQTQFVILARGLSARGHDVFVFTYHRAHDFHRSSFYGSGVKLLDAPDGVGWRGRIKALISIVTKENFDGVISYLKTPNLINTVVGVICRQQRIVVSERSSRFNDKNFLMERFRRELHRFADHVVTNSPGHAAWLRETFPHLRKKSTLILNGYAVPNLPDIPEKKLPQDLQLVAVGRITPLKQVDLFIKALVIVHRRRGFVPATTWVGRRDLYGADNDYAKALDRLLISNPCVADQWTWAGERKDVATMIGNHHLLVHPAFA